MRALLVLLDFSFLLTSPARLSARVKQNSLSSVAKWKHPKVTGVSLAGEERNMREDENLCYQDSDVIVWPVMDAIEEDEEGVEMCAICRFRERKEKRMKRKRGELAEESSSSEEEQEDEEKEEMIEQQQNQKEKREFSSKPPPPPPPSKRMLGYVLEVLEKEDEDEDGGDETNEPVRILVLNCTEEDVKKSKHALCKCLVNNDGMRKHNISGVFFLSSDDGKENDAMLKNNNEAVIDIDSKNIFTIGGGDNSNEVGFRSSMRHLARLHCAVPSVFPLPESLTKTSCPSCEDNDSKRTTMTLGLCDEVAFYSNRNINGGEKNQHEITRGEDILNERTGDRKLPKLGLLDVFENLERFDSFKENARKAKHKIFSSDIGDEQKNTKEVEREKDEDEDELLPASFGKYPAHPKKGHTAPSSTLGGPETIFLGTGCAEPSKYRAASAILLRDEEGIGASKSSILLDCGEGCLGAMRRYLGDDGCLNALKTLKMVWISHHHPDHCLGILAVLEARYKALRQQSAASSSPLTTPPPPLLIVGPTPIQKWFEIIDVPSFKYTFMKSRELQARGGIGGPFHISVMNKPGLSHPPPPPPLATKGNNSTFLQPKYPDVAAHVAKTINCQQVVAVPVTHCPEAFAIILRGLFTTKRSVAYSGDCTPSKDFAKAAYAVDILIHEATFGNSLWSHAKKKKHCTTEEALRVGRESDAKTVCLTHFSQRYPKDIFTSSNSAPSQQQQEQEQMFACAFDGMRVKWKDWELLKSNRARISDVLSKTSTEDIFVDKEEEHLAHMDID